MKGLYTEKYRILMKEIKEDTNEKTFSVHGLEGFILWNIHTN